MALTSVPILITINILHILIFSCPSSTSQYQVCASVLGHPCCLPSLYPWSFQERCHHTSGEHPVDCHHLLDNDGALQLDMMIEMKMLKVSNMKKLLSSFKLGVDLDTRDDYIRF